MENNNIEPISEVENSDQTLPSSNVAEPVAVTESNPVPEPVTSNDTAPVPTVASDNNAPDPAPIHAANSTVGLNGPMPEELKGWNWGAFLLTPFWGLSHNYWIALIFFLSFIPFIGFVVGPIGFGLSIYLGVKGNEIAWQKRKFKSIEDFKTVQKIWMNWGLGSILIWCAAIAGAIFWATTKMSA